MSMNSNASDFRAYQPIVQRRFRAIIAGAENEIDVAAKMDGDRDEDDAEEDVREAQLRQPGGPVDVRAAGDGRREDGVEERGRGGQAVAEKHSRDPWRRWRRWRRWTL